MDGMVHIELEANDLVSLQECIESRLERWREIRGILKYGGLVEERDLGEVFELREADEGVAVFERLLKAVKTPIKRNSSSGSPKSDRGTAVADLRSAFYSLNSFLLDVTTRSFEEEPEIDDARFAIEKRLAELVEEGGAAAKSSESDVLN